MAKQSNVKEWVGQLKDAYPDAPSHLTAEHEIENMEALSGWFDRIESIREAWDEVDEEEIDLPDSFDADEGGRQVLPVLMTIEDMTPEEKKAWHNLFVPISAMMADISHGYWESHGGDQTSLSFQDLLNYLPVIFLYVLSSYDPHRAGGDHEEDFSDDTDRIRLTTWVHQDTRRHIRSYLQQHLHVVGQGSGYIHRLRRRIREIRNESYTSEGREPNHEEIVDALKNTGEGRDTSREKLREHVEDLSKQSGVRSMSDPVSGPGQSENDLTFGDLATTDSGAVEHLYDPEEYLEERIGDQLKPLMSACKKLAFGDEALTFRERRFLDT